MKERGSGIRCRRQSILDRRVPLGAGKLGQAWCRRGRRKVRLVGVEMLGDEAAEIAGFISITMASLSMGSSFSFVVIHTAHQLYSESAHVFTGKTEGRSGDQERSLFQCLASQGTPAHVLNGRKCRPPSSTLEGRVRPCQEYSSVGFG